MIVDTHGIQRDSQLIVTMAKQALHNLSYYKELPYQDNFRAEFRTVRLGLPRQSGHTTAALQLMYEYPKSILFVPAATSRICAMSSLKKLTADEQVLRVIHDSIRVLGAKIPPNIRSERVRQFIIFDGVGRMNRDAIEQAKNICTAEIILELQ